MTPKQLRDGDGHLPDLLHEMKKVIETSKIDAAQTLRSTLSHPLGTYFILSSSLSLSGGNTLAATILYGGMVALLQLSRDLAATLLLVNSTVLECVYSLQ